MRSYDMGCDCGKDQDMTPAEKAECEKSAKLEAPDQVYKFDKKQPVNFKKKKNYWQPMDAKTKKLNNMRIVGGCPAGHTPWFVYLKITGGC